MNIITAFKKSLDPQTGLKLYGPQGCFFLVFKIAAGLRGIEGVRIHRDISELISYYLSGFKEKNIQNVRELART